METPAQRARREKEEQHSAADLYRANAKEIAAHAKWKTERAHGKSPEEAYGGANKKSD